MRGKNVTERASRYQEDKQEHDVGITHKGCIHNVQYLYCGCLT